ncbi:MAG TPA: 3-isopropylmalate dehydrogenase [Dongiaceae bacterium]|nr:3-isopropylmalate dehydrogenase [Dongiaceae bacterium]
MEKRIALLPGDGIGREVVPQAVKVLKALERYGLRCLFTEAPIGGAGVDAADDPLPPATLDLAKASDAVLLGAVGAPKYEHLPRSKRPGLGLLKLRKALDLYANLRPAKLFPELIGASPLKAERVEGLDLIIVRELTGDIYFGEPRGISGEEGTREGVNTMRYTEREIRRVAHFAFRLARGRRKKVLSIDKANVLETMVLWRQIVTETGKSYPEIALSHQYVDAAAMELIRGPRDLDVVVTGNMFGDILSDEAAMLTGSLGMLPSASLGDDEPGLYEPVHGSAPDIAGQDKANPIAAILSAALMLDHGFGRPDLSSRVEQAVRRVLAANLRTADIAEPGTRIVGCDEMGSAIAAAI